MQTVLDQFRASIQRVRDFHALYVYFGDATAPILDLSDLLRAQIVLCVSALDYYVHELTRLGMVEIIEGGRPTTPAFLSFRVTIESVMSGMQPDGTSSWLDAEVRARHGVLSFQQADKIADAIRLISTVKLWDEVGDRFNRPSKDVKNHLQLIVQRRNKIAHEADIKPGFPGERWPITPADVLDATDFVESLCETIHMIVV
ncbi:MAG: HEPN domain-containing protein [Isosphaeraceae bacterium]